MLVGRALHEDDVCEGWRSEAKEVMGVWLELDRKRWRGSEGVLRARERHTKSAGTEGPEPFGNGREAFHEVLARGRGGERRAIWAALSRSKMIMGPPHCGHVHRELGGGVAAEPSPFPGVGGCAGVELVADCRSWKQRGRSRARRR